MLNKAVVRDDIGERMTLPSTTPNEFRDIESRASSHGDDDVTRCPAKPLDTGQNIFVARVTFKGVKFNDAAGFPMWCQLQL